MKCLAYRHHYRLPVPAEPLETGDEAACLCEDHAGVVVVVRAGIEDRAVRAIDEFQERVAQLRQLVQYGRWKDLRARVRKKKEKK